MSVAAKAGRDAGWSRRRTLQTAGAALVSAVGIAEHAADAGAQSPAASASCCNHSHDSARFQSCLACRRSPELAICPLQLAEPDPGVAAGSATHRRRRLSSHQLARNEQSDDGIGSVQYGRRRVAGLSKCAPRTRDRSSHDSGFRPDESWRCGGAGVGAPGRICLRQALVRRHIIGDIWARRRRISCS